MQTRFYLYLVLFVSISLFSCDKEEVVVNGMAPVYISSTDFSLVKSIEPQPFEDLGKIVNVGDYIFINEIYKGIHVVDNSNPQSPKNIRFFNIPGNKEFTIKENILYADNSVHLLVIDISNIYDIKVLNYIEDLYVDTPVNDPVPPNDYKGYFECVDKKKGIHVGWEEKELINPLCEAY